MDSSEVTESTSSSSNLRFPIPAGSRKISSMVNTTLPADTMARHEVEENNTLGDSAYEIIDTDDESRATESVASTDFGGHPDDVASLADTEQSGDDSGDEESPGKVPRLIYQFEQEIRTSNAKSKYWILY